MQQLFLFTLFAVPLVWRPGPVNILLAGLGANHGIGKNLPFVGGLICSATLISILCLLGFQVFLQNQLVYQWMLVAGSLYIIYLAVKMYRLRPNTIEQNMVTHRFQDGLLVNLLNPKFYMMVTAVFAQFCWFVRKKRNYCIGWIYFYFIDRAHSLAWFGQNASSGQLFLPHHPSFPHRRESSETCKPVRVFHKEV